jgi:hypothetical protein
MFWFDVKVTVKGNFQTSAPSLYRVLSPWFSSSCGCRSELVLFALLMLIEHVSISTLNPRSFRTDILTPRQAAGGLHLWNGHRTSEVPAGSSPDPPQIGGSLGSQVWKVRWLQWELVSLDLSNFRSRLGRPQIQLMRFASTMFRAWFFQQVLEERAALQCAVPRAKIHDVH